MKDQLETLIAMMYSGGILYSEAVREFKKKFVMHVLAECKGNQSQAAHVLGMHRNTLGRIIAELKVDVRQFQTKGRPSPRFYPKSVHPQEQVAHTLRSYMAARAGR